jgi:hypothetical protein
MTQIKAHWFIDHDPLTDPMKDFPFDSLFVQGFPSSDHHRINVKEVLSVFRELGCEPDFYSVKPREYPFSRTFSSVE